MRRNIERILGAAAVFCLALPAGGQPLGAEPAAGVIVEAAEAGYAAQAAGLQPGDEILAWSSVGDGGPVGGWVESPFQLSEIEYAQGSRADTLLSGRRGSQPVTWLLPRDHWWRLTVRPALPPGAAKLYREGGEKIATGDLSGGEARWRAAVDELVAGGDSLRAAWLLQRTADELARAGSWTAADAAYERAQRTVGSAVNPSAAVRLLTGWADTFLRRKDWKRAADTLERALALQRRFLPRSPMAAQILVYLGNTAWYKGDLAAAEELHGRAMRAFEELEPESLDMASALNNWANVASGRGDLERAEADLRHAEEILRRIDPDALLHGVILADLGNVLFFRADLPGAESLYLQALTLFEKHPADSEELLQTLNNLAEVAELRGDLATSEDLLLRSLHLSEKRRDNRLELVDLLGNLGRVASTRGDLDLAESRFRRSLEIAEALLPGSPKLAEALARFAGLARRRGDYRAARDALRRALAIQQAQAPGSFHLAAALLQLAAVDLASGETRAAEEGFRKARILLESQVPGSPALAEALAGLGDVAARRGDPQRGIELYRQALAQQEKTGSDTAVEAQYLHALGRTERSAGLAEEGARHLCEALDVLDRQRRKLGGSGEERAVFEASNREIYHDCLEALLSQQRPHQAFTILERGRARAFLDLLAERDLEISGLSPETAAEQRRLDAESDRLQAKILAPASNPPAGELAELQGKLRELRAQQEQLASRIRRESPRFASLRYPEPLSLAGTRAALDPGTVLLEYAVGPQSTRLFVVRSADASGAGLSVFRIAAGERRLRAEVEGFRRLLARPGSDRKALRGRARRLYDLLVRPAEKQITGAQRLLFSPDGPLHTLPFAALMHGDRYLVEWKPLHFAISATVYAELARSRPAHRQLSEEPLVAFGDPAYPRTAAGVPADPEVRQMVRRGLSLAPLFSSRKEVKAIAALYPQSRVYLGQEATEEKAKSLGPEARLVHFACHGLLDERFPLDSALALSLPEHPTEGQDNGLLQAWEIFESMRLDADLVTLSACDTALGKEMGGEGLIGLTRAFQYAGARSVLASLWGIADYSTAAFMQDFYGYLSRGKPKDEALQAAQIDQIRKKSGLSHPFFWAALELSGDWR